MSTDSPEDSTSPTASASEPAFVLPSAPGLGAVFQALLKQPQALAERFQVHSSGGLWLRLGLLVLGSVALFGLVMGNFSMGTQLWATPLKLLLGITFSALICFPSLFIFGSLAGAQLHLRPLVLGLLGFLALHGLLLLGFAPVLWVFTRSTESVTFIGALTLAIWLLSTGLAYGFLRTFFAGAGAKNPAMLKLWFAIFLLVALQMSTALRPLLAPSDALFTSEKKFFLHHWGASFDLEVNQPVTR